MHQARKRFGQHFLHDNNIIARIVSAIAPDEGDNLLEIGPGQGALTYPLLKQCKQLTAVELDRDLIPILQKGAAKYGQLDIINSDILKFDLNVLAGGETYRIAGNLPYNISTPLMFHLMASISRIQDMHFMVQKEVALRIVAGVGDKNYGRLSIMMQYYCRCEYLFDVPPESFTPPPKVDSSIIRLIPHQQTLIQVDDFELFSLLVKTAFGQRRKTISNSLKTLVDPACFAAAEIDSRLRAECLTSEDFARLTNAKLNQETGKK
ncbi:MAG: 16S rRNA (adenine1518-N6/adenine1519-N6)-dimethyltransferase [Gammaproteobacteria bacterium]|jgi:16S rRNA (adenine1518-N6/adenine1519-N6)-dimethyltransferase